MQGAIGANLLEFREQLGGKLLLVVVVVVFIPDLAALYT